MKYTLLFVFLFSLIACGGNHQSPEVVYPENTVDSTETTNTLLEPIEKNLFTDFPFAFDSTSLYIFPVKNTFDSRGSSDRTSNDFSNYKSYSYSDVTYLGMDKTSGWFYNFLFQDEISETLRAITNKEVRFSEMTIIRDTINQQAIHTLLLKVYDKDSNQDKFLTRNDLMSYYVANEDGKRLRKISPEGHLLNGFTYEKRLKVLYFNTIEDSNKNGKFEDNDPHHQYFYSIKTGKIEEVKLPF